MYTNVLKLLIIILNMCYIEILKTIMFLKSITPCHRKLLCILRTGNHIHCIVACMDILNPVHIPNIALVEWK